MRNRKTKQQLVDDNEQAARIALYLPQLHAQKEKLEADLQELEHLALSGWGYADFHAGVNFAITEFSEVRIAPVRWTETTGEPNTPPRLWGS